MDRRGSRKVSEGRVSKLLCDLCLCQADRRRGRRNPLEFVQEADIQYREKGEARGACTSRSNAQTESPRSGAAFIKNILAFYLIAGNSFVIKVGPTTGEPKELYMMRPDRVKVLPGTRFQPIRGYRYTVNGVDRKPDFKEIGRASCRERV